jgi:hypothetical protein
MWISIPSLLPSLALKTRALPWTTSGLPPNSSCASKLPPPTLAGPQAASAGRLQQRGLAARQPGGFDPPGAVQFDPQVAKRRRAAAVAGRDPAADFDRDRRRRFPRQSGRREFGEEVDPHVARLDDLGARGGGERDRPEEEQRDGGESAARTHTHARV